jgi:hypothetical protein
MENSNGCDVDEIELERELNRLDSAVGKIEALLCIDDSPDLEQSGLKGRIEEVRTEFASLLGTIEKDRGIRERRRSTLVVWERILSLYERREDGLLTPWDASATDEATVKVRLGRIRDYARVHENCEELFGVR